MGVYFNPNNESFASDKRSQIYIDKTGLLEYLNQYNVIHLDISSSLPW